MQEKIYKYRLKLTKTKELKYISHLDWQNLILKIFRRCELKLALSQGFNKMPKVSYSPALPLFIESKCELVNFNLLEPLKNNFEEEFKKYSTPSIKLISITQLQENSNEPKSLENYIQWAKYEAKVDYKKNPIYNYDKIRYIIEKCLSSDELLISKKTKKGIKKTINYRDSLKSFEFKDDGVFTFVLKTGQNETIPSLRADEFLKSQFGDINIFKITRVEFYDTDFRII